MKKMMKIKISLKPCPFCGGKARISIGMSSFDDAQVYCTACYASGPMFDESEASTAKAKRWQNKLAVIEHWNTRS